MRVMGERPVARCALGAAAPDVGIERSVVAAQRVRTATTLRDVLPIEIIRVMSPTYQGL